MGSDVLKVVVHPICRDPFTTLQEGSRRLLGTLNALSFVEMHFNSSTLCGSFQNSTSLGRNRIAHETK